MKFGSLQLHFYQYIKTFGVAAKKTRLALLGQKQNILKQTPGTAEILLSITERLLWGQNTVRCFGRYLFGIWAWKYDTTIGAAWCDNRLDRWLNGLFMRNVRHKDEFRNVCDYRMAAHCPRAPGGKAVQWTTGNSALKEKVKRRIWSSKRSSRLCFSPSTESPPG